MTEETGLEMNSEPARKKPGPKPGSKKPGTKSRTGKIQGRVTRQNRVPMSQGANLFIPEHLKESGFYYRFAQDKDGRLDKMMQAGYEFVMSDGERYSVASGANRLYAMKLPQEYRDDDLKLKDKAAKATIVNEQKMSEGEYLPDDRKHVIEKDDYDPLA